MSSLWAIQGAVGCGQRKKPCNAVVARLFYAQMERFELSHRLSQSTPLAGAVKVCILLHYDRVWELFGSYKKSGLQQRNAR